MSPDAEKAKKSQQNVPHVLLGSESYLGSLFLGLIQFVHLYLLGFCYKEKEEHMRGHGLYLLSLKFLFHVIFPPRTRKL